jgi:hypothetical protein
MDPIRRLNGMLRESVAEITLTLGAQPLFFNGIEAEQTLGPVGTVVSHKQVLQALEQELGSFKLKLLQAVFDGTNSPNRSASLYFNVTCEGPKEHFLSWVAANFDNEDAPEAVRWKDVKRSEVTRVMDEGKERSTW